MAAEMEGEVWHLLADGSWAKLGLVLRGQSLEACDAESDEAGVAAQLIGNDGGAWTQTFEARLRGCEAHLAQKSDGAPTNYGLSVHLAAGQGGVLRFCLADSKELVRWRKAFKAAADAECGSSDSGGGERDQAQEEEKQTPAQATAAAAGDVATGADKALESVVAEAAEEQQQPEQQPEQVEEDDQLYLEVLKKLDKRASSGSPGSSPHGSDDSGAGFEPEQAEERGGSSSSSSSSSQSRKPASAPVPPASGTTEPAPEAAAGGDGLCFEITVSFEDLEMDLVFDSQADLDRVSVFDLKAALSNRINSDGNRFVKPSDLHLSLGGAALREYWKGRDFGLRSGVQLVASVRKGPGGGHGRVSKEKRAVVSAGVRVGGAASGTLAQQVSVVLREGDHPEQVADKVCQRVGVDPASHALPVTCELYKQLGAALDKDNKVLRNQVAELGRQVYGRVAAVNVPADRRSREVFESLLESASARIDTLEADKKVLADQLFELRLLNAERLSSA